MVRPLKIPHDARARLEALQEMQRRHIATAPGKRSDRKSTGKPAGGRPASHEPNGG